MNSWRDDGQILYWKDILLGSNFQLSHESKNQLQVQISKEKKKELWNLYERHKEKVNTGTECLIQHNKRKIL